MSAPLLAKSSARRNIIQVLTAPADEADRHDYIRGHVAEILGDIGDNRAFEILVECTESDSEFLRQKSIAALGKLGDVRSIGLLIAHLRNHWDAETREEAAWALGNFPELWVIRTLIRVLSDPADIVRDAAYSALVQIGQPARAELLRAAKTDDLSVRQQLLALLELVDRETLMSETEQSAMSIDDVIDEFYRACYVAHGPLYTVQTPYTPSEMIVGRDTETPDWIEWRLIERSPGIAADLAGLETEIGFVLPPSFKRWHSQYYTLDGDVRLVRLPSIPLDDALGPLKSEMFDQYLPDALWDKGYRPFGSDGNDTGPICFHIAAAVEDHEYPIYVWEHEGDGSEEWMMLMFSNFRKLLECCIHLAGGTLSHNPSPPAGNAGFAVIDPDGAGKYFRVV